MTKRDQSLNLESPLTTAVSTNQPADKRPRGSSSKSQKRARKEAQEDLEERQLTALVFGKPTEESDDNDHVGNAEGSEEENEKEFSFQIDRDGLAVKDDAHKEDIENEEGGDDGSSIPDDEDSPAWEDPDDVAVGLAGSSNRLRKLRTSREELTPVKGAELERRLRKRYEDTTQATARTDWARATSTQGNDGEEEAAKKLFSKSGSLLASSRNRLPPNALSIVRCPDANQTDPSKSVVQAVQFHPGSDRDKPLLLTAGLDKTLRFFQVGLEKSEKIHGIHFPKMPIYSATFLGNTGNVVVSGRRSFFYIYDAVAGKVDLVPRILGREEKSWERHTVSPDGKIIAFTGNDGYIVLVDSHSKHWIGDLKLNGSVRAVTFTPDGRYILASGSDGDIYRWDINSRRCIERFSNNDGTITASLAASSQHLAVGAESGVVNLYSEQASQKKKTPLRSIMNLHTSAECSRFNHDGQILAMSTQREQHGLKLMHVPSRTIFSNWPTSKTPLNYVWSVDFSPQSRFMAIGNDKGKCLLYQLNHYQEE